MGVKFFKTIRPWHVGLLTIHIWIYCTTHRPQPTDDLSIMSVMYVALSVFLIFVVLRMRRHPFSEAALKILDVLAAAGMSLSALLLALPLASDLWTTALGAALGGVGVGWAYLRWGEFYANLDIHYAAPLIFLSMALGSVGKTVVDALPAVPATVVLSCLPFVTFVAVRRSLRTVPDSPAPYRYYNDRTVGSLWRVVLGIAVYSFTVGIIQSASLDALPTPSLALLLVHHGGEVVLSLALLAWVVFFGRGLNFSRIWRLVLVLMATALIFAPYLEEVLGSYLFALIRIAQTFLIVFLFLTIADVARHSTYRCAVVFAMGWLSYSLPFSVGNMAGDALHVLGQDASVVMAALVWVLVVVTLFCLDESSAGNHLIFTELNDGGGDDTLAKRIGSVQETLDGSEAPDLLKQRCLVLSHTYRLTPRELDILELLARGRTKTYIADAFFISENTVRGHVKRLYAKLDVHSKQELVDRVESVEEASPSEPDGPYI